MLDANGQGSSIKWSSLPQVQHASIGVGTEEILNSGVSFVLIALKAFWNSKSKGGNGLGCEVHSGPSDGTFNVATNFRRGLIGESDRSLRGGRS